MVYLSAIRIAHGASTEWHVKILYLVEPSKNRSPVFMPCALPRRARALRWKLIKCGSLHKKKLATITPVFFCLRPSGAFAGNPAAIKSCAGAPVSPFRPPAMHTSPARHGAAAHLTAHYGSHPANASRQSFYTITTPKHFLAFRASCPPQPPPTYKKTP